jgi:hypothetical protein
MRQNQISEKEQFKYLAPVMNLRLAGIALVARAAASSALAEINRHALVTRHNIEWNDATGRMPLGNGEFCFTADGTGVQTFGGNSMSHWAWHSFPLPAGRTVAGERRGFCPLGRMVRHVH